MEIKSWYDFIQLVFIIGGGIWGALAIIKRATDKSKEEVMETVNEKLSGITKDVDDLKEWRNELSPLVAKIDTKLSTVIENSEEQKKSINAVTALFNSINVQVALIATKLSEKEKS